VSFEFAKTVFRDAFAVERLDDREDCGEERFVILGMAEGNILLFVAFAERNGRAEPDQPTKAYPMLIARDPDHVNLMLNSKRR
jgi:hypothetical protein